MCTILSNSVTTIPVKYNKLYSKQTFMGQIILCIVRLLSYKPKLLLNYVHLYMKCSTALVIHSLAYLPQSVRVFQLVMVRPWVVMSRE